MAKARNSILYTFIPLLCIVLQSSFILPHHHHKDSLDACFNVAHCIDTKNDCRDNILSEQQHNHQECDHSNNPAQDHKHDNNNVNCSISQLTIIEPQREESLSVAHTLLSPTPMFYSDTNSEKNHSSEHRSQLAALMCEVAPAVIPLYTEIVSRTIPARAPSFLS